MRPSLRVSPGSPHPIYRQIADQLRKAIVEGRIEEEEGLPSVRSLSEELVINPNTVVRAYTELVNEGLVESIQGKGYFVKNPHPKISEAERHRRFVAALEQFLTEARFLGIKPEQIIAAIQRVEY